MFLLLFSFLSILRTAEASILAIDYGSEFMKASLIKPGMPFDVLLNRDSKRKIQSTVSWKGDDRLFGQDAFNIVSEPSRLKFAISERLTPEMCLSFLK